MSEPWLSVITAIKDDPSGLVRTMESLRSQDLDGVEMIVVDGSKDPDTVRAICSGFADVHWETPTGIYAAMNSGLMRARGAYVQFLNAGDVLHASNVIERVRRSLASSSCEWAFGPVELIGEDGTRVVTPPWDYHREKAYSFARGHFPQHQGMFVRRSTLMDLGGFSVEYRIAADYRSFLQLSTLADPQILDLIVADFEEGGASTIHWQESFREFHRARHEVLQPSGMTALRERLDSLTHFGRVWAYREVVRPLKRRARR